METKKRMNERDDVVIKNSENLNMNDFISYRVDRQRNERCEELE